MTNDGTDLSAVIPCYNDSEYIRGAIESCLNQTTPPREIIVVDDGSTDDTESRVAEFGDRVRYIRTENQGAAAARNTGVEYAQMSFVAFLDADDRWHERKIEKQFATLRRHPTTDLIYTDFFLRDPSGTLLGREHAIEDGDRFARELFVSGGSVLPSSAVVRTATFESVGGFDETLSTGHDRDLWIRLGMSGDVHRIPEPLVFRTTRTDSLASDYLSKFENERRSMEKLANQFPELELLLNERYARMLCNRAAFQLSRGNSSHARSDALASLRHDHLQPKPLLIAVLSALPNRIAARSWQALRTMNRRTG